MIKSSEIKEIYSNLQQQLFYLIPEKWDRIYLYASVEEKMAGLETGELFFYYFPKGILKKNPINVYEIPYKFNLNEDEYIKLIEKLYNKIKKIREVLKKNNHRLWNSVTIRIEGLKFEIEYNYEQLDSTKYSDMDKHIIWKYINLKLPEEAFSSNERKIIRKYVNERIYFSPDIETYTESIYKNPVRKIVDYNREKRQVEYVPESEMKIIEEKAKNKFEEQHYTYKIRGKRKLRNLYKEEKNIKPKTYIEQIEEQRNSVKSQILKHIKKTKNNHHSALSNFVKIFSMYHRTILKIFTRFPSIMIILF